MAGGFFCVDVVGVNRVDAGEGDVAASRVFVPIFACAEALDVVVDVGWISERSEVAIERPALDDGQFREVDLIAFQHDFVARARASHALGWDFEERCEEFCFCE